MPGTPHNSPSEDSSPFYKGGNWGSARFWTRRRLSSEQSASVCRAILSGFKAAVQLSLHQTEIKIKIQPKAPCQPEGNHSRKHWIWPGPWGRGGQAGGMAGPFPIEGFAEVLLGPACLTHWYSGWQRLDGWFGFIVISTPFFKSN